MRASDDADRRSSGRRREDNLRAWLPIVVSLVGTVLAIGMFYGKLGGRLDLIEYRLSLIEQTIRR